ncbi:MAG: CTP synthase [bacterium]
MAKYIIITGGVVSSLGKGIASASIGKLLEEHGLKISLIKCDPYINIDPGTMSPFQHGEVYVTDDGAETDLDLGHYARFTNTSLAKENNITTGKIYYSVIMKERKGDYLGKTVQVIPHITTEIKNSIKQISHKKDLDVVIVEIGGTVGDIESLPFLEAVRQIMLEEGQNNAINIHLTLIPYIKSADEIKTKPTQHSVGKLREIGIQPNILLCRTEKPFSSEVKSKIALFCNVKENAVIQALDTDNIYEIPIMFQKDNLDNLIINMLDLKIKPCKKYLEEWKKIINIQKNLKQTITIAVVGKYIILQDAYKSIYESLTHAGIANNVEIKLKKVDSEKIEKEGAKKYLQDVQGILIPGGFGSRGIEGKIEAVKFARENKIPFFGICLGMQIAVIEFARNVCGFLKANSTEFEKNTPYPVISLLENQKNIKDKGGTMRLGAYLCSLEKNTHSFLAYENIKIYERHRHRYEFNNKYKNLMKKKGLVIAGIHPKGNLVEIIELKNHPWFLACQFHPEFKSKPDNAHPLFKSFIEAILKQKNIL